MANYSVLKSAIEAVIKTNGNNEITGALLQQSLISMITSLGAHYDFVDVATPSTNPGTPDQNVMYFAATAGTYTNFGGIVVNDGEACFLCYNGTWTKKVSGAATSAQVDEVVEDITEPFAETTTEGITNNISTRYINQGNGGLWGLYTNKVISRITKISVSMEANSTVDLAKVNTTSKTVSVLASLTNSGARAYVDYVPAEPLSLAADEFIGLYNGKVALYSLTEAGVPANAITYTISNGASHIETTWCVGLYLTTEKLPSVSEVMEIIKDSLSAASNVAVSKVFGDIGLVETSNTANNWGLNKKNVIVKEVRLTCSSNGHYDVFKYTSGGLELLGEIENAGTERKTKSLVFDDPIALGADEYICFGVHSGSAVNIPIVSVGSGGNAISGGTAVNDWSIPAEIVYLEYGDLQRAVDYLQDAIEESNLSGKTIAFLGDSITAQGYVTTWIENLTGAIVLNYGLFGSHLASKSASDTTSFQARYASMSNDVDMVVVWGGTNDFGHTSTAQFGDFGDGNDVSLYTFFSGLHALFSGLYAKYRGKPIVIVTPLHHGNEVDTPEYIVAVDGTMVAGTNPTTGKTFAEYVNAIKQVAAFYSFFVVDAYAESGLTPCVESAGNRYYFLDGLHPNNRGGNRLAKWMYPLLDGIFRQM